VTSAQPLFRSITEAPPPASLGGLRAVDTDLHLPEGPALVAIDDLGNRHLLVPVPIETAGRPDLGATVSVRVRTLTDRDTERRFIDVACTDRRLDDLFDIVVDEMVGELVGTPGNRRHRVCLRVLDRWRQLLRRGAGSLLGPEQLTGLLAELWWVDRIASVDAQAALDLWTGPRGAAHDLTGPELSIEIKAVTAVPVVEIHGIRQLEAPPGSNLVLAVVHLAPSGDEDGVTVPDLIDRSSESGVDTVELLTLLSGVGYEHSDREAYESFRWRVIDEGLRDVDDAFPRITPTTTDFGSHSAIGAVRYTLHLDSCPEPEDIDPDTLALRLVGAD